MSDVAIQAEGLGKLYHLGAGSHSRYRYRALRDMIADAVAAPFRRLRSTLDRRGDEGQQEAAGENSIWALRDVSLEVKQGEVLGIIGRNGAGKSTLLKLLSRITEPTEGRAEIRGRVGSLLEVGTGFHPELSGRENIYLNGAILGMRKKEIDRRFDAIVDFAELEKFLETPVKRYSSGMFVRLAFSVAAHLEPEILLVDEVLAVGDAAFRKKCLGKMGDVAKGGRTVLFVSHNMSAVSALCDRAVLLDDGRLVADDEAVVVVERYMVDAAQSADGAEAVREYSEVPAKAAQITRIRMLNDQGVLSTQHHLDKPLTVEADFVVRRPFANLMLACHLRRADGTHLCALYEPDWHNYTSGENIDILPKSPGGYTAHITLPAPLLNVGCYELTLVLLEPSVRDVDTVAGIFYDVVDTGTFSSCILRRARKSLLAVPAQWRVEGPY